MPTLLSNASATGIGKTWPGGTGHFAVVGTFGGATVTLQVLGPDGATWLPVSADTTLSAAGMGIFQCAPGQIRAAISGGPPSGIYASAERVRV